MNIWFDINSRISHVRKLPDDAVGHLYEFTIGEKGLKIHLSTNLEKIRQDHSLISSEPFEDVVKEALVRNLEGVM